MGEHDPPPPHPQQSLPALSRDALQHIEQAEKDARKRYNDDKMPHFPTHPEFSFFETDILYSRSRILDHIRIFAERVVDAHLVEYLDIAPAELLTNATLLESVDGEYSTFAVNYGTDTFASCSLKPPGGGPAT